MSNFKNDLLEYLLQNADTLVSIKHLTDKYCGEENTFELNDNSLIKNRQDANNVLNDLRRMGWINVVPKNGICVMYSIDNSINKMRFKNNEYVRAKLTTLGEIEYKKTKQEASINNSINVQGNVIGSMLGNQSSFENALTNPTTQTTKKTPNKKHKTSSLIEIGAWIAAIVGTIIVVWEFILKRFFNQP